MGFCVKKMVDWKTKQEPPNSTTWRKRRSFSTRLHFIHFLCRFLSPFPKEFPQSTLYERTRAHTHHLLTAVVASSSSSLSHHHHHHAHVCGKLCQNAVLDVKSKCASPSSRETTTFLDDADDGHEERQKQQQQH